MVLDSLLVQVGAWAHRQFPSSTDTSRIRHLGLEVAELARALEAGDDRHAASEAADVLMLLAHLAYEHRWDLGSEVEEKFAIVQTRRYDPPQADGLVEHSRE